MVATRQPISQVVSTARERRARFALQMAQQAHKVGGRIAEIRVKQGLKQRDLVARMAELGDQALNTNQLSRYENGGAMPNETRLSRFAEALETTVEDLHAGPIAERKPPKTSADGDGPLDQLGLAADFAAIRRQLDRIMEVMEENQNSLKVLLQHHPYPAPRLREKNTEPQP